MSSQPEPVETSALRANVLGVGISPMTIETVSDRVQEAAAEEGFSGYVTVTGVHGVMESQRDPSLRRIHNRSFLSTPDGVPMVWLARWNGFENVDRVYGPDLMLEIFRRSQETGETHFLFGGGDGVVDHLAEEMCGKYPGVKIVGKVTPPFRPLTEDEEDDLLAELQEKRPHFFWVGLSTPKQEKFMHELLSKYPRICADWPHGMIMFGVGAAFDFHAGLVRQAPSWIQRMGMEWAFRLIMEPRRLWRRYFSNNPAFVWRALAQMTGLKKYPMEK